MGISSARAPELLLHTTVGVGTGFKLAERRLQAGERLFMAAAAPEEKAEICDDLAFVVIVVQLTEDGGSLLETIERPLVVAGVAECQREVIQRHRLAASLTEPADEFQSVCVGRNCPLSVAAPAQVRTAGVETSGLPAWVGRGFPPSASRALPPEFVGPLPCDQSASRENVPPVRDGALENPYCPSNLACQVLPARERDNGNPTGGGEEREEGEEGEGDELGEADRGEEAEDSQHEANECGGPLAHSHTVRRRLERRARGCEDAFWRHVRGVLHHLIHS
jgi:hypothetical protein